MSENKKIRSGRISKQQKEKLLDIMRSNRRVALRQFGGANSAKTNQEVWQTVSEELNAVGGACKTADQWKKSWSDWKVAVKKQQAAILRFKNRTGNPPASEGPPPLQGLDMELLEFYPAAAVEGDGITAEGGFTVERMPDDEEIQGQLDDLLSTPTVTSKRPPTTPKETPKTCATKPSYDSAFEEVKKMIVQQGERSHSQMAEVLSTLKSIDGTLKEWAEHLKK